MHLRRRGHLLAAAALVAALTAPMMTSQAAHAEVTFNPLPQAAMSVIDFSSEEVAGEGANGRAAQVLDGKPDTYWHTKWQPAPVAPPHHLTVKLAAAPVELARVRLLPRQSSNGSGRVHQYELWTSAADGCAADTFAKQAEGAFDGLLANKAIERAITLDKPVAALCAKVVYLSTWGGADTGDTSPAEKVGSLAEFNADILGEEVVGDPKPVDIVVPDGAVEIASSALKVRLHPAFPQVVDYRLGDHQVAGKAGKVLKEIRVNGKAQPVKVSAPVKDDGGAVATYALSFPELAGVSMSAKFTVTDNVLEMTLTDIVDPERTVRTVSIPDQDIITLSSASDKAAFYAANFSVDRSATGDSHQLLAKMSAQTGTPSYAIVATDGKLAFGFTNNSTEDYSAPKNASRTGNISTRWHRSVAVDGPTKFGTITSGNWVVRGTSADLGLGPDADPFWKVKVTADANADGVVDWQDGAIATRDIRAPHLGADTVKNEVVSRIPFNIVSQATHPFLRTLDDTKRIALATDGLGQKVLLKGYQDQGHDSAHPDYAGHYNEMAGGLKDLTTLVNEGENYNATFGVHVNATESYSEAHAFSDDLLFMPPQAAWGWMNQSYYIDGPKDLGTKKVLERFQQFRDEVPANLKWLYIDVYWPDGWEGQRLGAELAKQGWVVGSEWSDKFPDQNVWSHWSQEENYGGTANKGINSQLIRFVENTTRDTWNPHPILSNTNLVDFEGWTGHNDYHAFIKNVFYRNLPAKFLQQSEIMRWGDDTITFANGTVATSPEASVGGTVVPTNRTFTYDGAKVYENGSYLLPWSDGGTDRLYHYNLPGGQTTWKLTDTWAKQTALTVYKLTDTGRVKVADLTPSAGKVTIGAEPATAYVLYPTSALPKTVEPKWGQGSSIADPGFFSGTVDAYATTGAVSVETSDRGNFQALLGAGPSALSQQLNLPAGDYSAWAWIEIQPGQQRPTTVEVAGDGVKPVAYQDGKPGVAATTIKASTMVNSPGSDEKYGTYFQRVRVTFTTDARPVTLTVKAGNGSAAVRVDDLRVVPFTAPVDPHPSAQTVLFDDFEHVDTGYWPLVQGTAGAGGDSRSQIQTKHEPYSQKGWYGKNKEGRVVAGGKLNDNVLRGQHSLMANEENGGQIWRTSSSSVALKPGHTYRVSFDYQVAYADTYAFAVGADTPSGGTVASKVLAQKPLPQAHETTTYRQEVPIESCGVHWFGFYKTGGNHQANLTIDDFRLEDLGPSSNPVTCVTGGLDFVQGSMVRAGGSTVVKTVASSMEAGPVTGLTHSLKVPDGWTATLVEDGVSEIAESESSVATWLVKAPQTATGPSAEISMSASFALDGKSATVTAAKALTVLRADDVYLSDRQDTVVGTPTNGWGPVEWDASNGESEAGDSTTMTIAGVGYAKGVGAHANSEITFDLAGQCTAFSALAGVDDEVNGRGTVIFEVLADGKTVAGPTDVVRGGQAPMALTADITGAKQLTLKATDAGDGAGGDHVDWALARVACGENQPVAQLAPQVSVDKAEVEPGGQIVVSVTGYVEGIPAVVYLHSEPVRLGELAVAADGTGSATVTIPVDTAPGEHRLEVRQVDAGISKLSFESATAVVQVGKADVLTTVPSTSATTTSQVTTSSEVVSAPGTSHDSTSSASEPGSLSATGSPVGFGALLLAGGLIVGGGSLLLRQRRHQH